MILEKSSLTIRLALEIDREASVLTLIEALKEQLNSEGHEHGDDLRLYEVEITEIFFYKSFFIKIKSKNNVKNSFKIIRLNENTVQEILSLLYQVIPTTNSY